MVQNSDFYDLIDRIVCLDIGARGVAGLFEPARALVDEPMSLSAARHLSELSAGDTVFIICLLYTSPSPRDGLLSRMPSSA